MLHLHFALNFDHLTQNMIQAIRAFWNSPMASPILIFPNRVLEQWFKIQWMQNIGIVANLRVESLDHFLFSALNPDDNRIKLTKDILRNIIIAVLQKRLNTHEVFYQSLGNVRKYLENPEGSILDEGKLFAFADRMADVFLNYELTRPSHFHPTCPKGFIQTWLDDEFLFDESQMETWQRTLYKALFAKMGDSISFVNAIFQQQEAQEGNTLLSCFEKNIQLNGKPTFYHQTQQPIFIFWHAGIAQGYRTVLRAFAEQYDVYAYIQNPCMAFWEDIQNNKPVFKQNNELSDTDCEDASTDNENILLAKWGKAGRDNIRLWCETSQYTFEFAELDQEVDINCDSLLHALQYLVSQRENNWNKQDDVSLYFEDNSITLHSAPSKLREIEHLHSQICKLLESGAKIKDIVIFAPNLTLYRSEIYQIFDQAKKRVEWQKKLKESQTGLLHIPFSLLDGCPKESLTHRALKSLFNIVEKRALTRQGFLELIKNPLVQAVRGITTDDIQAWEHWIASMHIYRDRERIEFLDNEVYLDDAYLDARIDWKTGVQRLLLAKLTENSVELDNYESILPYNDWMSHSEDTLLRFVSCVEELENLCEYAKLDYNGITENTLNEYLLPSLQAWVSLKDFPEELGSEICIYKNLMEGLKGLHCQFLALQKQDHKHIPRISWKIIEQTLLKAAEESEYVQGNIFINGLSFMQFKPVRIVPAKHVFFIGMDAASFPGHNVQNSLDLTKQRPWIGDTSIMAKNKYAFLGQFMSTKNSFHLSYVNQDLKKDEEFYPSTVINDLKEAIQTAFHYNFPTHNIPLDETREWSELYTGQALRNRGIFDNSTLSGNHTNASDEIRLNPIVEKNAEKYPNYLPLYKLVQYLEDPFQMRVKHLLGQEDEDELGDIAAYEPIALPHQLVVQTIKEMLKCYFKYQDIKTRNYELENIFTKMRNESLLPDGKYAELTCSELKTIYKNLTKQFDKTQENLFADEFMTAIEQIIPPKTPFRWELHAKNPDWHNATGTRFVSIRSIPAQTDKIKLFLKPYLSALAYTAYLSKLNPNEDIHSIKNITLEVYAFTGTVLKQSITITPKQATDILIKIYQYAFIDNYFDAAPIEFVRLEEKKKHTSFDDFIRDLENEYGPWRFFNKASLFQKETDLGYTHDNFAEKWNSNSRRQASLILF